MGFVTDIIGDITGSNQAADAAVEAARIQAGGAQSGIDSIVELMSPFITGGTSAFSAQQDLLGLGGAEAQAAAISGLEQSPLFQSTLQQGEDALLQNASATGGIRGGNVQGALGQLRPQMLMQQIQQQLGNLGGLSSMGLSAASGQGSNVANLFGQQSAATAGGALAAGGARQNAFGNLLSIGGIAGGLMGGPRRGGGF